MGKTSINLKRLSADAVGVLRHNWPGLLGLVAALWLVLEASYLPRALAYAGSARDLSGPFGLVLVIFDVAGSSAMFALVTAITLTRLANGTKLVPIDLRSALLAVPTITAVRLIVGWPRVLEPLLVSWHPALAPVLRVLLGGIAVLTTLVYVSLFGLFVPTLVVERLGLFASFARAFRLMKGVRATFTVAYIIVLILIVLPQILVRTPVMLHALATAAAKFGSGVVYLAEIQVVVVPIAVIEVAYGVFVAAYYQQCAGISPSRETIVDTFI